MEKKKNFVKDIYVWLEGGKQKACSVKCDNRDIELLLNALESKYHKMFTYGESYRVFYGEGSLEKSFRLCSAKVERLISAENGDLER